jgi:hypothetical protein
LPGHKCKQRLLVTESLRFDAGIRGNALQIGGRRRSEQVASGTLRNVREGKVQGVSLRHEVDCYASWGVKAASIGLY